MVLVEVWVTFDNRRETRKQIHGFTFLKSLIELRISMHNLTTNKFSILEL